MPAALDSAKGAGGAEGDRGRAQTPVNQGFGGQVTGEREHEAEAGVYHRSAARKDDYGGEARNIGAARNIGEAR